MGKVHAKKSIRRDRKSKLKRLLRELIESSGTSETDSTADRSDIESGIDSENTPLAELASTTASSAAPAIDDIESLMGTKLEEVKGPEVPMEVAALLTTCLHKGLDKETKANLITGYPPLANCGALLPPLLNLEIKGCLDSDTLKHDNFLTKVQQQLAAALSALAIPFSLQYAETRANPTEDTRKKLEKLGAPIKLVADVLHTLSLHRRYLILPTLDADVKRIISDCPIDDLLFGKEFPEQLKTSREAKKLGSSLKKKTSSTRPAPYIQQTKLIKIGAVSQTVPKLDQFISSFFLVPKPNGEKRFILNLKNLNQFLEAPHFKLEYRRTVLKLIYKECVFTRIDLKDAYFLIISQNKREAKAHLHMVIDLLLTLGFIINYEKSALQPSHVCQYLGFIFNSSKLLLTMPDDKRLRILTDINKLTYSTEYFPISSHPWPLWYISPFFKLPAPEATGPLEKGGGEEVIPSLPPSVTQVIPFAGRLRYFLSNWLRLTNDKVILQWISGYVMPFIKPPCQTHFQKYRDDGNILALKDSLSKNDISMY